MATHLKTSLMARLTTDRNLLAFDLLDRFAFLESDFSCSYFSISMRRVYFLVLPKCYSIEYINVALCHILYVNYYQQKIYQHYNYMYITGILNLSHIM